MGPIRSPQVERQLPATISEFPHLQLLFSRLLEPLKDAADEARSIGAQKAKWTFHHPFVGPVLYTLANVLRARLRFSVVPTWSTDGPCAGQRCPFFYALPTSKPRPSQARPFPLSGLHGCPFARHVSREQPPFAWDGNDNGATPGVPAWADVECVWTSKPRQGSKRRTDNGIPTFLCFTLVQWTQSQACSCCTRALCQGSRAEIAVYRGSAQQPCCSVHSPESNARGMLTSSPAECSGVQIFSSLACLLDQPQPHIFAACRAFQNSFGRFTLPASSITSHMTVFRSPFGCVPVCHLL
ncbi:hypothetical protein VUR80DRAFT_8340 [Thermomyces stellatus]